MTFESSTTRILRVLVNRGRPGPTWPAVSLKHFAGGRLPLGGLWAGPVASFKEAVRRRQSMAGLLEPVDRVALLFAYDGTCFDGYSRQADPGLWTVEGALMAALVEAGVARDQEALAWRTGSRTDRGVSARQNVVVFSSLAPAARVCRAVGGRIDGLWPVAAASVPMDHDPRRARWREYRYFLPGRWTRGELRRFEEILGTFVGTHDFSAFSRKEEGRDPKRRVDEVAVVPGEDGVVLHLRGGSFLRQQVRRMVAAGLAALEGQVEVEEIRRRLDAGGPPFELAPAPAEPLVLWSLHEPGVGYLPAGDLGPRVGEKKRWAQATAWARASLYRSLAAPPDGPG